MESMGDVDVGLALALKLEKEEEAAELDRDNTQVVFTNTFTRKNDRSDFFDEKGKVKLQYVAEALESRKHNNQLDDVYEALDNHYTPQDFKNREAKHLQSADEHANHGGDTTKPKMCTISFPGKARGALFRAIKAANLRMGRNGDIHAMNDQRVGIVGAEDRVKMPRAIMKLVKQTKHFGTMLDFLASKQCSATLEYKDRKSGPKWFIAEWAKAAFYSAKNSEKKGTGIVMFANWEGFLESRWCKLEYLFAKCLCELYPNSVYIYKGKNDKTGEFMNQDTELLEFNISDL